MKTYMYSRLREKKLTSGFTVAELAAVIVIVGILAGLSAFGYGNWQQSLTQRQVKSDLTMASTAMESAKNFSNGYPLALPATYTPSSGITLTYVGGNATAYCIEARGTQLTSVVYYIDSTGSKNPQSGTCGAAYQLAAPSPSIGTVTTTSMVVTWPAVSGATGYVVRYGTSTPSTAASCTSSPCTISGLTAATNYVVQVTASSAYKTAASNTVNALTTPSAPAPSATPTSATAINVTWSAVSGATGYIVRYGTGSPTTVASCTSSPCAITGLAQGTTYNVSVVATNSSGSGTAGTASATTFAPPPVPTSLAYGYPGGQCWSDDGITSQKSTYLQWTAVSNSQAPTYRVYSNGVFKRTITNTLSSAGTLAMPANANDIYDSWPYNQERTLSYTVRAVSPQGIESANSAALSTTWPASNCYY